MVIIQSYLVSSQSDREVLATVQPEVSCTWEPGSGNGGGEGSVDTHVGRSVSSLLGQLVLFPPLVSCAHCEPSHPSKRAFSLGCREDMSSRSTGLAVPTCVCWGKEAQAL